MFPHLLLKPVLLKPLPRPQSAATAYTTIFWVGSRGCGAQAKRATMRKRCRAVVMNNVEPRRINSSGIDKSAPTAADTPNVIRILPKASSPSAHTPYDCGRMSKHPPFATHTSATDNVTGI